MLLNAPRSHAHRPGAWSPGSLPGGSALGGGVDDVLELGVDLVPLGQQLVHVALADHRPQRGLSDLPEKDAAVMAAARRPVAAAAFDEKNGRDHDHASPRQMKVLVGSAVAGRRADGDRLAISDAQPAVAPGLVRAAGILQRRLDPVPAGRPARRGRKCPRDHRPRAHRYRLILPHLKITIQRGT